MEAETLNPYLDWKRPTHPHDRELSFGLVVAAYWHKHGQLPPNADSYPFDAWAAIHRACPAGLDDLKSLVWKKTVELAASFREWHTVFRLNILNEKAVGLAVEKMAECLRSEPYPAVEDWQTLFEATSERHGAIRAEALTKIAERLKL